MRDEDRIARIPKRFWSRVGVRGPDDCWLWSGGRGGRGYGMFWYEGKNVKAHRVAWLLTNGPIPEGSGYHGTCVLHDCDTPLCVNPSHLFLGTAADNTRDMIEKGRHKISNRRKGNRLLSYKGSTKTVSEWAREYGLKPVTVFRRLDAGWSVCDALETSPIRPKIIKVHGLSLTLREWEKRSGISYATIHERLARGWCPERAVTEKPK